jgi:hypothetical protein
MVALPVLSMMDGISTWTWILMLGTFNNSRGLCSTLQVLLGLDNDSELYINNIDHLDLLKEEPDSESIILYIISHWIYREVNL